MLTIWTIVLWMQPINSHTLRCLLNLNSSNLSMRAHSAVWWNRMRRIRAIQGRKSEAQVLTQLNMSVRVRITRSRKAIKSSRSRISSMCAQPRSRPNLADRVANATSWCISNHKSRAACPIIWPLPTSLPSSPTITTLSQTMRIQASSSATRSISLTMGRPLNRTSSR